MDHWFHGDGGPSKQLQDDFAAYGAEVPAELRKRSDCPIWPENVPAVELFLRCSTQWRSPQPTRICGLDYGVVLRLATLYLEPSIEIKDVLDDLQVMELRALELFAERRQEAG